MVGHIYDLGQGGNRLQQDSLDSLFQRDLGEATALTATEQPEIGDGPVHRHQLGTAAMSGNGRVDLFDYDLLHLIDERA